MRAARGSRWHAVAALVTVLGLVGCGSGVVIRASQKTPAALPIRAFPEIWILRGEVPAERELAERLAAHLAVSARSRVELVDAAHLERLRSRGRVGPASVVVALRLEVQEQTETRWGTRPEPICDALGCYTVQRTYAYDVPALAATLVVRVFDGPSGRLRQRLVLRSDDAGAAEIYLQRGAIEALGAQLEHATEQQVVEVEAELLEVDMPAVAQALAEARAGRVAEALRQLEPLGRPDALAALPGPTRARVLYDLAQLWRLAPGDAAVRAGRLARAQAALEAALRLDGDERYARALRAVARAQADLRAIQDQRAAAEHNFRLAGQPAGR